MRTKTHVVLVREEGSEALNLFDSLATQSFEGTVMQTSNNNDFIFSQVGKDVLTLDLNT
jgi:hypothetical protein